MVVEYIPHFLILISRLFRSIHHLLHLPNTPSNFIKPMESNRHIGLPYNLRSSNSFLTLTLSQVYGVS